MCTHEMLPMDWDNFIKGSSVHVAPACAGSGEGWGITILLWHLIPSLAPPTWETDQPTAEEQLPVANTQICLEKTHATNKCSIAKKCIHHKCLTEYIMSLYHRISSMLQIIDKLIYLYKKQEHQL
jgi:hypothetical protein